MAYFGSRADGDLYRADLRTGEGEVFSQGPGTASVGLKVDRAGRIFVAGGPSGTGRAVDAATGEILATYPFTTGESFVNDVLLTGVTAWFTDSRQAQLYRLPRGGDGLPTPAEVDRLPLTGEWVQAPAGTNSANGIAPTPDGDGLIVMNSSEAALFRVDPSTGEADRVDLGGVPMTNGDGLLLVGSTLYVVQNRLNRVAVIELDPQGTSGAVTGLSDLRRLQRADDRRPARRVALPAQREVRRSRPDRVLGDPDRPALRGGRRRQTQVTVTRMAGIMQRWT